MPGSGAMFGKCAIRDEHTHKRAGNVSREAVIAAIYETVIRPSLFDAFMDAWDDHIRAALNEAPGTGQPNDDEPPLDLDPELQAHFDRAYEILQQIGRKAPKGGLGDRIAASPAFTLLASADGPVLAAGEQARAVLGPDASLETLEEFLAAGSVRLLRDLRQSVRSNADAAAEAGRAVVLSSAGTTAGSGPETVPDLPRYLIARILSPSEDPGATAPRLIVEALNFRWSDRAGQMLVTSFGLSPAEVEIVRNLMNGLTLRDIARVSGRSEHTIRNQSKSVLAKTGAPGQVDLIRLVAFLISGDEPAAPAVAGHSSGNGAAMRDEEIRMSSGLRMQLFHAGSRTGQPVIFLHGMLDGMASLQFHRDLLHRRGLRIVAPVRPGYGRSEPVKDPRDALSIVAEHVSEISDRLDLDRPVILGHLGGTTYARAAAARMGAGCSGLVSVSGGVPITRVAQLADMPPRQRLVAYTARYTPALLPFVLRAGIAQIDSDDIEGFMAAIFRPGTHDRDVIETLGLEPLLQKAYRFSVQQGHLGFAADSQLVVQDWTGLIAGRPDRATHVHGGRDRVIPVGDLRAFVSGLPGEDVLELPNSAQLLFYEHPDVVLDAVEACFTGDARQPGAR